MKNFEFLGFHVKHQREKKREKIEIRLVVERTFVAAIT